MTKQELIHDNQILDERINQWKGIPPKGFDGYSINDSHFSMDFILKRAKELGWINGYKYGVEYPTNGKKPDLISDVVISWRNKIGKSGTCMAGELEWRIGDNINEVVKFRILDERYKPKTEPLGNTEQLDNSWHERGELPPLGWKGLVNNGGDTEYFECEVVAYHYNGKPILKTKGVSHNMLIEKPDCWKFRPIKTEREKFVDAVRALAGEKQCEIPLSFCASLYDAGFRAPEDK